MSVASVSKIGSTRAITDWPATGANFVAPRNSTRRRRFWEPPPSRIDDGTPESFLPLPRDTFHILVSLADRERHGYSVMLDVAERTDGALRLSPSSLYATIKRLLTQRLIEELDERPDPKHDDERRRYYRLTKLGRRVAMAEARRLERLLLDARATGLLPRPRLSKEG